MSYGHTITLDLPFPDAVGKVKDAFGAQGSAGRGPGGTPRTSAVSGTAR